MTSPNQSAKSLEEIKAEARRYALSTTKAAKPPYAPTFLAPAAVPEEGAEESETNGEEEVDDPQGEDTTTDQHTKPSAVSIDDEEYLKFVLGLKNDREKLPFEDDEDEFQLDPMEDLEDDDEEEEDTSDANDPASSSMNSTNTSGTGHPTAHDDDTTDWDIQEELDWLQEDDDMELNLTNLVNEEPDLTPDQPNDLHSDEDNADIQWVHKLSGLTNTLHDRNNPPMPTQLQQEKLRSLLKRHYQLLLQQAIMAVRMAHTDKNKNRARDGNGKFQRGHKGPPERTVVIENADDLIEIVDSAVGKLIDLRQKRQDSFRTILAPQQDTLLTRAQFRKVKETVEGLHTMTMFDVPGLDELDDTFTSIDQSVNGSDEETNILWMEKHLDACHKIFTDRKLEYNPLLVPGAKDVSAAFSNPMEVLGADFTIPCSQSQEIFLRRQRNIFTAAEDNLTIRGVNMFGEKHWLYISDRFLPDRSGNIISHRYAKLTTMIFKAHGIPVRPDGSLPPLKKLTMLRDVHYPSLDALRIVPPPPHSNVRKWTIHEDLALLHAARVLGTMWAEISNRVLPHRDRGHLRKRYQVLERRIKATCSRDEKHGRSWRRREKSLKITTALGKPPNAGPKPAPQQQPPPNQNNPNAMHNAIMPALQQFSASLPPNYSAMTPPTMQMVPPHQPYGWIPYGAVPGPYMPVAATPQRPNQMPQPVHPMVPYGAIPSPPHPMRAPGNGETNLGDNSLAAVEKLIADHNNDESKGASQQSLFTGVMQMAQDEKTIPGGSPSAKATNNATAERPTTPPCYYPPPSPSATIGTFAHNTQITRPSVFESPSLEKANADADQLEAASALSALSQSPALKKSPPQTTKKESKPSRSLFSLVTGGSSGLSKKKKATESKADLPPSKRKKTSP